MYSAIVVSVLLLISLGMASFNLIGMEFRRQVPNPEITIGEAVDILMTAENKKALPAFWTFWQDHIETGMDIEGPTCCYKTIPSWGKHSLKYKLHSTRRGLFRIGPVIMETSGPLGMVRRFVVTDKIDFVTVLPRTVSIGRGAALGHRPVHQVPRRRSIFEDPSRFIGMREYRPGDSMRRIHWRATARSGKLQVKLFEPTVLTGILLAVDMSLSSYPYTRTNPNDIDETLEFTITVSGSVGQFILANDQSVGLISNGTDAADLYPEHWKGGSFRRLDQALEQTKLAAQDRPYQPVELPASKGQWQSALLLSSLARLKPFTGIDLADLLMTELPRLPRSLVLTVITPRLDDKLCNTLDSLKRSGIECAVLWICRTGEGENPPTLPQSMSYHIPVYPISSDEDIEQLGGQSL